MSDVQVSEADSLGPTQSAASLLQRRRLGRPTAAPRDGEAPQAASLVLTCAGKRVGAGGMALGVEPEHTRARRARAQVNEVGTEPELDGRRSPRIAEVGFSVGGLHCWPSPRLCRATRQQEGGRD